MPHFRYVPFEDVLLETSYPVAPDTAFQEMFAFDGDTSVAFRFDGFAGVGTVVGVFVAFLVGVTFLVGVFVAFLVGVGVDYLVGVGVALMRSYVSAKLGSSFSESYDDQVSG